MSNRCIHVEVVAPVRNHKAITLQCLRSLSRIDRTGLEVHIIIVDDGSTDGASDAIREQFPEVQLVPGDGNLWYTAGANVLCIPAEHYRDRRASATHALASKHLL